MIIVKKIINNIIMVCIGLFMFYDPCFSQDTIKIEKDNRPVRPPFESGVIIDNQTVIVPSANTLEFMIQHRFGTINSNTFDLIGLYAPSNIRIGLSYSLFDFLQVGIGTTKSNKIQDINWKWSIIQQTRSNSIPVALTYFGNVEFIAKEKELFGQEYKFSHRITYYHQLIIARKFTDKLSIQLSAAYAHYNQVDSASFGNIKHDNFAVSANGRYKITAQLGVIFVYDMPLTTPDNIKPNAGLGVEIATSSHRFQIFLGSYDKISPQYNMVFNTNDFTKKDILIGFNITRLWNF